MMPDDLMLLLERDWPPVLNPAYHFTPELLAGLHDHCLTRSETPTPDGSYLFPTTTGDQIEIWEDGSYRNIPKIGPL